MFSPRLIAPLAIVVCLAGCRGIPRDDIGSQPVDISGRIVRQVFPGPPEYESVSTGDEPLNYWVLVADQPVTNMGSCGFSRPITPAEASRLQLVLDAYGIQYKQYAPLVGPHVEIRGICFWAHTGHHCTPLLIEVKDIRPIAASH
jgi:hypothetical protein